MHIVGGQDPRCLILAGRGAVQSGEEGSHAYVVGERTRATVERGGELAPVAGVEGSFFARHGKLCVWVRVDWLYPIYFFLGRPDRPFSV